jgi:hypothetical protein
MDQDHLHPFVVFSMSSLSATWWRAGNKEWTAVWLLTAAALLSIRAVMFGFISTPTLRIIFGVERSDTFGPVGEYRIDLGDPLLLLGGLLCLGLAVGSYARSK